jgi:hypothetical protein
MGMATSGFFQQIKAALRLPACWPTLADALIYREKYIVLGAASTLPAEGIDIISLPARFSYRPARFSDNNQRVNSVPGVSVREPVGGKGQAR